MAPRVRRNPPRRWIRRGAAQQSVPIVVALLAACCAAPREAAAETIEAALARAYENNPQLNAQRAIVRQTDESVPQALSGYRPTITANATVGRQYTNTKEIIPPTPADFAKRRRIRRSRPDDTLLGRRHRLADVLQRRANRQ